MPTDQDATARLDWALRTAAEVGDQLLGGFRTGIASTAKDRGIVTDLDRRAEDFIARSLLRAFPGDGLLAEEGTGRDSSSGYRWVVDPLDGTTNFVAGLPLFAVSLGCVDERGALLGVVLAPALGDVFSAVRGGGFGRSATTAAGSLGAAVFIVNKAYHPAPLLWGAAGGLMGSVRAFRTFGCVSLDLALVAAGRADGLVLLPADPWDVAAGLLLVGEAGLQAGDLAGAPNPTGQRGILATSPLLFAQAAALLDPAPLAG